MGILTCGLEVENGPLSGRGGGGYLLKDGQRGVATRAFGPWSCFDYALVEGYSPHEATGEFWVFEGAGAKLKRTRS